MQPKQHRYKCRHFNKYDDAISPSLFFHSIQSQPMFFLCLLCNFVVYLALLCDSLSISFLLLYAFMHQRWCCSRLLCIPYNIVLLSHFLSLSLLRTRDVLPFSVYTFHIVYSIADCCEKLSLAIMLNKTKIVKYTCNKFSVESKLVCSLLEVVVCTIHATNTHIHQARTQNMYKQRHRHRHRDFYRMMNKLFHYCSFGSVKQTRLWTTKLKDRRKKTSQWKVHVR